MRKKPLKQKPLVSIVLAILVLLLLSVVTSHWPSPSLHERLPRNIPPILIQDDKDFDEEHGVIGGSGTTSDPYLIEGWNIDASQGDCSNRSCAAIAIQNVSLSFIIRNVSVRGRMYDDGVRLSDVRNARIEGTTITTGGTGILVIASTNLTITQDVVTGSDEGVSLEESHDVYILANNVSRGTQGIVMRDSSRVRAVDNLLYDNRANGIILLNVVDGTVEGNTIINTAFRAITMGDSSNILVTRNQIAGCGEECIYLFYGSRNSIIQNEISGCDWAGIALLASNDNVLKDNSITATPSGIFLSEESCNNLVAWNKVANASLGIAVTSDCNLLVNNSATGNTIGTAHTGAVDSESDPSQDDRSPSVRRFVSDLTSDRRAPVIQRSASGFLVS